METTNSTSNSKVLVVDDEAYVRGLLKDMLDIMGLNVIEADDGLAGMAAFNAETSDISACVIDLAMPGMTGMELLKRIRQAGSTVPVMLIGGYARHEVRQTEARSSNVVFLQKPFSFEQFQSTMEQQLAG
jgi:DNA-binding NtrC family response regulator